MSGYVKAFKDEDENNELISFCIDDEKLLEKYKAIWNKIEDLRNIELNYLPTYNGRYTKTKIRTYGNKVYTYFRDLNVLEDDIECESFTVISIDSLLVYDNKYYLQVYLDDCVYENVIIGFLITDSNFKILYTMVCISRFDNVKCSY